MYMDVQLTPRQEQIRDEYAAYNDKKGYPPTVRELCDIVGLSSSSTMQFHLDRLRRKGALGRVTRRIRGQDMARVVLEKDRRIAELEAQLAAYERNG